MNLLTQDDLEFRKNYIGASDAPIIMEVSPWTTPYQLWSEKLDLVPPRQMNSAMRRGNELEETARKEFEKQTGLTVFPKRKISDKYEWQMATFDGIDIEEKNIVEIKCPGVMDHLRAMEGEVPEKYYPQLQHQMLVAGLNKAYYFSYREDSTKILEVYRDDEYCSKLIEKELAFYNCMTNLEPPQLTEKDYVERNDDLWLQAANGWLTVKARLKELQESEEYLRHVLINASGSSNSRGGGVTVTKTARKGAVDYGSIPELEEVNLELYRKKPIEFWKVISQ